MRRSARGHCHSAPVAHQPGGQTARQKGSVLIISIVFLAAVGATAAGTLTLIQRNAEISNEQTLMLRGLGVADSLRLAADQANENGDELDVVLGPTSRERFEDILQEEGRGNVETANESNVRGSLQVGNRTFGYCFDPDDNELAINWTCE